MDINSVEQLKEILYLIEISNKLIKGNYQKIKMNYRIYLNNKGLDIIDKQNGLYKFECISSLFTLLNNCELFCLKYKSKTTLFICGKEIIIEKYSTSIIPLNKYKIKFLNLNNVMNQKYFLCKSTCFSCNKTPEERERNLDSITIYYDIKMP